MENVTELEKQYTEEILKIYNRQAITNINAYLNQMNQVIDMVKAEEILADRDSDTYKAFEEGIVKAIRKAYTDAEVTELMTFAKKYPTLTESNERMMTVAYDKINDILTATKEDIMDNKPYELPVLDIIDLSDEKLKFIDMIDMRNVLLKEAPGADMTAINANDEIPEDTKRIFKEAYVRISDQIDAIISHSLAEFDDEIIKDSIRQKEEFPDLTSKIQIFSELFVDETNNWFGDIMGKYLDFLKNGDIEDGELLDEPIVE